mmetsp:Transcript_73938/g.117835  ORF Transcript_73938/g.117835 Transcript_73938/m.117835 type:complete len:297 (+) Transcript_73938:28-918(+)
MRVSRTKRDESQRSDKSCIAIVVFIGFILTIFLFFVVSNLHKSISVTPTYYDFSVNASSLTSTAFPSAHASETSNRALNVDQFDLSQLPLLMKPNEIVLFSKYVIACSQSTHCQYLEWGSGGSTELISMLMDNSLDIHIDSIEHAVPWCTSMKNNGIVKVAIAINKLTFHCVDTQVPLVVYGRPLNNDTATLERMQVYINYVDTIQKNGKYFDLVLIDGRFRVACGLKLILAKHIDANSVVLVHDYVGMNRPYPFLEKYYDKVDLVHGLAVLKVKSDIDFEELQADFDHWRYDAER